MSYDSATETAARAPEPHHRGVPGCASRFRRPVQGAESGTALEVARLHGEERRRLERDLHDGAQQRLVSLSLQLSRLALRLAPESEEARLLATAQSELRASLAELRDLAHGLHPAVLTDYGLEAALQAACTRAPLPVRLIFDVDRGLPAPVELAVYYLVCEALTNVAKYAHARAAVVEVSVDDGTLVVEIADDGIGGASMSAGSGLRGLAERLGALGGTLELTSPCGLGTTLRASVPLCVAV